MVGIEQFEGPGDKIENLGGMDNCRAVQVFQERMSASAVDVDPADLSEGLVSEGLAGEFVKDVIMPTVTTIGGVVVRKFGPAAIKASVKAAPRALLMGAKGMALAAPAMALHMAKGMAFDNAINYVLSKVAGPQQQHGGGGGMGGGSVDIPDWRIQQALQEYMARNPQDHQALMGQELAIHSKVKEKAHSHIHREAEAEFGLTFERMMEMARYTENDPPIEIDALKGKKSSKTKVRTTLNQPSPPKSKADNVIPFSKKAAPKWWEKEEGDFTTLGSFEKPHEPGHSYVDTRLMARDAAIAGAGVIIIGAVVVMAARKVIDWWNNAGQSVVSMTDTQLRADIDKNLDRYYPVPSVISKATTDPLFRRRLINDVFDEVRASEKSANQRTILAKSGHLRNDFPGMYTTIKNYEQAKNGSGIKGAAVTAFHDVKNFAAAGSKLVVKDIGTQIVNTASATFKALVAEATVQIIGGAVSVITGGRVGVDKIRQLRGQSSSGFKKTVEEEAKVEGEKMLLKFCSELEENGRNKEAFEIRKLWAASSSEFRKNILSNIEEKIDEAYQRIEQGGSSGEVNWTKASGSTFSTHKEPGKTSIEDELKKLRPDLA